MPNGSPAGGYLRRSSRVRIRRGATFFNRRSRPHSIKRRRVYLGPVYFKENDPIAPGERLETGALASAIGARGPHALACASNDQILERMLSDARAGDVALFMSNGPFDAGLKERFLAAAEVGIDQVQQRAIRGEPFQILREQLARLVHVTAIGAGNVRRQDDILQIPKRASDFERFMLEHVEARAANLSRSQRRGHRALVDHTRRGRC